MVLFFYKFLVSLRSRPDPLAIRIAVKFATKYKRTALNNRYSVTTRAHLLLRTALTIRAFSANAYSRITLLGRLRHRYCVIDIASALPSPAHYCSITTVEIYIHCSLFQFQIKYHFTLL